MDIAYSLRGKARAGDFMMLKVLPWVGLMPKRTTILQIRQEGPALNIRVPFLGLGHRAVELPEDT